MMARAKSAPEPTFEEALRRLEEIVARLESGQLTLDEMIAAFEEGSKLVRLCNRRLDEIEARIERLVQMDDGQPQLEPFQPEVPETSTAPVEEAGEEDVSLEGGGNS